MKAFLRLIIKRCLIPALLVMLLISATAQAAEISPLEGLEMARKGFAGMTDFTAEITQEKQIALLKKTMTSSGQVRFRRPDTFYMEVYSPYASRLLLKDNILTMFLPAEGIRQKTVLPPEEGLRHWFSLFDRQVTRLPAGVEIRAERRRETITLRIIPTGKKGVKEFRLTLFADGRPRRLAIEEQNRDRTIITFNRVRKNVGLSEKDFRIE
ncbi:MAG TPA: outer-membrane lipoprotein carrier protein LolA [Geobacteraceae bacterium]|nr:outer-membrane lipoprotein carrier protein LolA [Geobacteraceae bacterium]